MLETLPRRFAVAALALSGCAAFDKNSEDPEPFVDPNADADVDADADADTDADADAATDTDADVDTGGGDTDAQFCDVALSPPGMMNTCVTSTVGCGSTVTSTTFGGSNSFSGEGYRTWFCTTAGDGDYSGGERVYAFQKPENVAATISLNSPCDDLHLFVLEYADWADSCPDPTERLSRCEFDDEEDGGSIFLDYDDREYDYLIIVEGETPIEENFQLTVECE